MKTSIVLTSEIRWEHGDINEQAYNLSDAEKETLLASLKKRFGKKPWFDDKWGVGLLEYAINNESLSEDIKINLRIGDVVSEELIIASIGMTETLYDLDVRYGTNYMVYCRSFELMSGEMELIVWLHDIGEDYPELCRKNIGL